jgi:hypothetical protein
LKYAPRWRRVIDFINQFDTVSLSMSEVDWLPLVRSAKGCGYAANTGLDIDNCKGHSDTASSLGGGAFFIYQK